MKLTNHIKLITKAKISLCALFLITNTLLLTNYSKAQTFDSISVYQHEITEMVDQTVERNFMTFPAFGHVEPTVFERNFCPHKYIKTKNEKILLDVAFQLTIRMLNLRSAPIRTPDYFPSATAYALLKQNIDGSNLYGSIAVAHHSNGQDGSFYNEDQSVNLKDGNFSTNFIKIGFTKSCSFLNNTSKSFYSWSFEQHLDVDRNVELNGIYGFSRLHFDYRSKEISLSTNKKSNKRNHFLRFSTNNTLIVDKIANSKLTDISKQVISSFKIFYRNAALKNLSVFIQAYQGQDYYNIQFVNNISFIRAGVCCEPSRVLAVKRNRTSSKNNI